MKYFLLIPTIISAMVIVLIALFLGYFSLPVIKNNGFFSLVFTGEYALYPMLIGSISIALLSTFFAFVYSICIALYMDSIKNQKFATLLRASFALFSSIPTVVYGFLGVILVLPFMRGVFGGSGMSLLSASLVLSLVITPTMVLFFIDSFKNIPKEYNLIVNSLGGDRIDYQMRVLLRISFGSISIGLIMGFARAIGDTMIALMLAGNSIQTPHLLLDSMRTLTSHIALLFAGDFDSVEFQSIFVSGLLLFCISTSMLLIVRYLRRRVANC